MICPGVQASIYIEPQRVVSNNKSRPGMRLGSRSTHPKLSTRGDSLWLTPMISALVVANCP